MEEKAFSGKWDIYAIFWFALDWSNHLQKKRRRRNDSVFWNNFKIRKKFLSEKIGVIMDMVIGLREGWLRQIRLIYGKVQKGMGSFSIRKFMLQILGTLNRVL